MTFLFSLSQHYLFSMWKIYSTVLNCTFMCLSNANKSLHGTKGRLSCCFPSAVFVPLLSSNSCRDGAACQGEAVWKKQNEKIKWHKRSFAALIFSPLSFEDEEA